MNDYQNSMSQSFFSRLLNRPRLSGFARELDALIPNCESLKNVSDTDIQSLIDRYRISVPTHKIGLASTNILVARATKLSAQQIKDGYGDILNRLASQLHADINPINKILLNQKMTIFQEKYEEILEEGPIIGDNLKKVIDFGHSLGLNQSIMELCVSKVAKPKIDRILSDISKDPIISPQIEREISNLAEGFGVVLQFGDKETEHLFSVGRMRWQLRNGIMPVSDSPLMLVGGETCHGSVKCSLVEKRKRAGENYHNEEGTGHLVVTEKRLLFSGDNKSVSINWKTIIDLIVYNDAIEIRRATGRPIIFVYGDKNFFFHELIIAARKNHIF